jgi:hypothetical protein
VEAKAQDVAEKIKSSGHKAADQVSDGAQKTAAKVDVVADKMKT